MTFNYEDMLNVHLKYIDYLYSKTLLSHQAVKNIALCGSECEEEIRSFFQNLLPERFRITHGYILHASDNTSEPKISPQADFVIVDNLVTNKLFTLDKNNGMEVVPVESVVGLFEIKRTLTKESFNQAVTHLKNIINSVSIKKNDVTQYLPGGIPLPIGSQSGIYSNPLLGIITLDDDGSLTIDDLGEKARELQLDFVASFKGLILHPVEPGGINPSNLLIRNIIHENTKLTYTLFHAGNVTQATALSRLIGHFCAYLANCTGRRINVNNYFYNQTIFKTCGTASFYRGPNNPE